MRYFLLLSLFASLYTSCDDEQDACLNDPDCEYFRCKVNGEDWSTNCERDPLFACSAIDVQYYKGSGSLEAISTNSNENQNIRFNVKGQKLKIGNNKLYIDNFIKTQFVDGKLQSGCKLFPLDTTLNYNLIISTLDTINFKIEGTYYFTGKNECGDTRIISDGSFRVKYRF